VSRARPLASLKALAIGYLSRREYSRQELRSKLLAALRRRERAAQQAVALAAAGGGAGPSAPSSGLDEAFVAPDLLHGGHLGGGASDARLGPDSDAESRRQVETLLDWLHANGYLSDERFVDSRVHARAARQGLARIRQELANHGLALAPEQAAALRDTEFTRAQAVWQRKFGAPAADARGRAAQARFLAARGFAADVVRRIVGGEDEF
jgi:regulatory protein